MKSKAMVLTKFNSPLELEEFNIPELKEGQVLIKMEATGICGSDIHMWKGEDPRIPLPIILGHEGIGTIHDLKGNKLTVDGKNLNKGDRVFWNRGVTCNKCYACKILREPSLCSNRMVYGISVSCNEKPYLNGCYSEYLILDQKTDIFKVEEEVKPEIMVSASCSGATVAHAFDMLNEHLIGKTVVIQGPGPLGCYAVAFAEELGAKNIIVIGGSESRLEICKEFGATHLINRHKYNIEERKNEIYKITNELGADIGIEAIGIGGVCTEGLQYLRRGGTYLSLGFAQPAGIEGIDFYRDIVYKNVTIHGVWVSDTKHTKQAMELVLKKKELFEKIVTHRYPLKDANIALEKMNKKEALKAVLVF